VENPIETIQSRYFLLVSQSASEESHGGGEEGNSHGYHLGTSLWSLRISGSSWGGSKISSSVPGIDSHGNYVILSSSSGGRVDDTSLDHHVMWDACWCGCGVFSCPGNSNLCSQTNSLGSCTTCTKSYTIGSSQALSSPRLTSCESGNSGSSATFDISVEPVGPSS